MRRNYGSSFRNSRAYTSPGTPEYSNINNGDIPKTWSSERIPFPGPALMMPFNSGRALPSKWNDAERWITSPLSGYGAFKNLIAQPHQRQPKSKSGPLGPTGPVYLPPNCSPSGHSPLTTGVLLVPDGPLSSLYGEGNNMTESSMPSSQDDKVDGTKEEEARVSCRDMATQMSPEGSTHSSSRGRLSFSNLPSSIPNSEHVHGNKDDVRDVQVDRGTSTARHSKKQGLKKMGSNNIEDLPSAWSVGEANISKLQREEANITAWENLQKAKAEAAIRKLEMKLEKKRSASMDKITNKLRAAQMKSQAMRDLLSDQAPINSHKGFSFCIYVKVLFFR